jgi:adenylate kinase
MTTRRDRTSWLQGGDAICEGLPPAGSRTWRLVLLGAPGVGKGTQAGLLADALGACPLSTGDVFRAARGTAVAPDSAMARARTTMARGELVSDAVVLDLVRERSRCLHCRGGFMLDGFPRTLPQAQALDTLLATEGLALDAVISYELAHDELLARLTGRRVCPSCQAVFHLTARPPAIADRCDDCGNRLDQRADDHPEAVSVRLAAYAADTAPVAGHYRARGLLVPIEATGRPADVFVRTTAALGGRVPG